MAQQKNIFGPGQVIVFERKREEAFSGPKNFLYFLNFVGARRPIRFNYVEASAPPIPLNLSPKDYLLQCIDIVPWEDQDMAWNGLFERYPNSLLQELLAKAEANRPLPQRHKLLGLMRGLLRPSDFIFLEHPEEGITPEDFGLFQEALINHIRSTEQVVFIATHRDELWQGLISGRVRRLANNEFSMESLPPETFTQDSGHLVFKRGPQLLPSTTKNKKVA